MSAACVPAPRAAPHPTGRRGAVLRAALVVLAALCASPPLAAQPVHAPLPSSPQASAAGQPTVVAAFSPGEALPLVLGTIQGARSSVLVAAYTFTSKPVALALRDAQRRGVQVFVLADAGEAAKGYSAVRFLANAQVPVRVNARYALQHNKFMVIDGATVQSGSFNYTAAAADRNAENVLVVRNAPAIAAAYDAEWRRLWREASELPPAY